MLSSTQFSKLVHEIRIRWLNINVRPLNLQIQFPSDDKYQYQLNFLMINTMWLIEILICFRINPCNNILIWCSFSEHASIPSLCSISYWLKEVLFFGCFAVNINPHWVAFEESEPMTTANVTRQQRKGFKKQLFKAVTSRVSFELSLRIRDRMSQYLVLERNSNFHRQQNFHGLEFLPFIDFLIFKLECVSCWWGTRWWEKLALSHPFQEGTMQNMQRIGIFGHILNLWINPWCFQMELNYYVHCLLECY